MNKYLKLLIIAVAVFIFGGFIGIGKVKADTLTVYSDAEDGFLRSNDATWTVARAGTGGQLVDGTTITVGSSTTLYYTREAFLSFDTSSIPDSATISSVTLSLYGLADTSTFDTQIRVRPYSWGTTLEFADWIPGANLTGYTLLATYETSAWSLSGYNDFTENSTNFQSAINKTGTTSLVLHVDTLESASAPSTPEHVVAYASEDTGTSRDPKLVIVYLIPPTITSPTNTNIAKYSATLGGNVTSDGGASITGRGVCVGTSANPALGGNCFSTSGTTGVFTVDATSLFSNTLYHYRAYATNSQGTSYTTDDSFTTLGGTVVSESMTATTTQFGGIQRKVAYSTASGAWYALYTSGGVVYYKKSTDSSTWGSGVDIDSGDTNNANPSMFQYGNNIYVAWIDTSTNTLEVKAIDTGNSDTLGTKCTSSSPGTLSSNYTVSVAVDSGGVVYLATTDTAAGTVAAVYKLTYSGCSFSDITTGSGLTAGDRPVLATIGTNLQMVYQDGNLSHSVYSGSSWTSSNTTIASVTDSVYSTTADGTNLWVLSAATAGTSTNFYKYNGSTWSTQTAPWTSETNVTYTSLSFVTGGNLYAHVIKDASNHAYWAYTSTSSISWTGGDTYASYGFTGGSLSQLSSTYSVPRPELAAVTLLNNTTLMFDLQNVASAANQTTMLTRMGANTDASGTTTLFARLAQISDTKVGTSSDTGSSATLFGRLGSNTDNSQCSSTGCTNETLFGITRNNGIPRGKRLLSIFGGDGNETFIAANSDLTPGMHQFATGTVTGTIAPNGGSLNINNAALYLFYAGNLAVNGSISVSGFGNNGGNGGNGGNGSGDGAAVGVGGAGGLRGGVSATSNGSNGGNASNSVGAGGGAPGGSSTSTSSVAGAGGGGGGGGGAGNSGRPGGGGGGGGASQTAGSNGGWGGLNANPGQQGDPVTQNSKSLSDVIFLDAANRFSKLFLSFGAGGGGGGSGGGGGLNGGGGAGNSGRPGGGGGSGGGGGLNGGGGGGSGGGGGGGGILYIEANAVTVNSGGSITAAGQNGGNGGNGGINGGASNGLGGNTGMGGVRGTAPTDGVLGGNGANESGGAGGGGGGGGGGGMLYIRTHKYTNSGTVSANGGLGGARGIGGAMSSLTRNGRPGANGAAGANGFLFVEIVP